MVVLVVTVWPEKTSLQKLPKNVGDLGKLIVAKGFKMLPKLQKIATSGHTGGKQDAWTYIIQWPISIVINYDSRVSTLEVIIKVQLNGTMHLEIQSK